MRRYPESSKKQARTNTRNLLFKLRQAWPNMGEVIAVDRTDVTWRQGAAIEVDAHRFELLRGQAAGNGDVNERIRLLTAAVGCYRGDLLPDCYAEWALTVHEQLRARYANVLETLAHALMERRRYEEALTRAKQLRDHDPLQESTYRLLMQVHAALAHAPDDPMLCIELLGKQSAVFHKSLQFDNWRKNLDEQLARLAAITDPAPRIALAVDLDRSRYFGAIGEGKAATDAARAAIAIAKTLNDALARGYQKLGYAFWMRTRMLEASDNFGQSAHYARLAQAPATEATSLEMQAMTGMFSGMPMPQINSNSGR